MNGNLPNLKEIGLKARQATRPMANAKAEQKNAALEAIAQALEKNSKAILDANSKDLEAAKASLLSEAMLDRLSLHGRIQSIADDVRKVSLLPDPIGEIFDPIKLPNGLDLCKQRTPIGVIGVIYEARPNVTIDTAILTIKSGNCAILRGGSETLLTNTTLTKLIRQALEETKLPQNAIQLIEHADRRLVKEMLVLNNYIDLIIPRGGAGLHTFCKMNSTIPVLTGGIGICHIFADETVELDKAIPLIENAKTQRPTVCNALDTLLVHKAIAEKLIPRVVESLSKLRVSFRVDKKTWAIMDKFQDLSKSTIQIAGKKDWDTEWLSLILGIKVVDSIDDALAHIYQHSSGHSDGILTNNSENAARFVKEVDSAAVYVNASTRFTDGSQFGLGAEVAISTQKLHARGPMGLRELTSYKWVGRGDYLIRK